jgi:tRNA pseudouridine55 synthase
MPPAYSAIKINGERAYDIARDGETPALKSRQVNVISFELIKAQPDRARFSVRCGKGTYMRSLARDLALELGTAGYIAELKRLSVGPFFLEEAISLDILEGIGKTARLEDCLLPPETALDDIPALAVSEAEAARIRNGQALSFISRQDNNRLLDAGIERAPDVHISCLVIQGGQAVALAETDGADIRPVRVFNL